MAFISLKTCCKVYDFLYRFQCSGSSKRSLGNSKLRRHHQHLLRPQKKSEHNKAYSFLIVFSPKHSAARHCAVLSSLSTALRKPSLCRPGCLLNSKNSESSPHLLWEQGSTCNSAKLKLQLRWPGAGPNIQMLQTMLQPWRVIEI